MPRRDLQRERPPLSDPGSSCIPVPQLCSDPLCSVGSPATGLCISPLPRHPPGVVALQPLS